MTTWQPQEAKGKFSEVVKRALSEGKQGITVHGESMAVLISREEYGRLTHPKPGFVESMRQSSLLRACPQLTGLFILECRAECLISGQRPKDTHFETISGNALRNRCPAAKAMWV
jgi:prevent-host-death family protein